MRAFSSASSWRRIIWIALQRWRPAHHWAYAARTTLYGLIPGVYFLAGRVLEGRAVDGVAGMLGAWLLLLPITVSIGVVRARRRQRA